MARIEGYAVPLSVGPGDVIAFHVSSPDNYEVTYVRLKEQPDGTPGLPVASPFPMDGWVQSNGSEPWQDGCGWKPNFRLTISTEWRSGYYAARCTTPSGDQFYIVFIVRASPLRPSGIAALASTNTWNAYNGWGGLSKYDGAAIGSFERPNPATSPVDDGTVNHLTRAELWILNWLEDAGYAYDAYTDHDLHSGTLDLRGYRALILNTHPEYWTIRMRDILDQFLLQGGSVLYLGGNGVFERCEYTNGDTALEFWGGNPGLGRERNFFRNQGRPEREVLGVGFFFNNYIYQGDQVSILCPPSPYRVEMAQHCLFAGTGVVNGELIGRTGRNRRTGDPPELGAASGWEMDISDSATAPDGVVVSGWLDYPGLKPHDNPLQPGDRGTPPRNLIILARGANPPVEGPYSAHLTYYETGHGGFVFSVGSLCFGGSLAVDSQLQTVVSNALNEALLPRRQLRPVAGSRITAFQPFEGHVDLFWTSIDGSVASTFFEPDGGWRARFAIQPGIRMRPGSAVAALLPFEGHVDLFTTRNDGVVMSSFFETTNGWQPWFVIDSGVQMHPVDPVTALQPFEGHVDLFGTSSDGTIMSTFFEPDGGWQPWFPIRPETRTRTRAEVSALRPFEGHIDLFATGDDGTVMTTFFEASGGWRPWFAIHPEVQMRPGATVTVLQPFEGHVDLFCTRSDGTVMSTFFESDGGWRPWFAIHAEVAMAPGATISVLLPFEGHVDLFCTRTDGTVMSTFF